MFKVYVLNNSFDCVSTTSVGRALVLVQDGHADVVKWSDKVVRTTRELVKIPLIIRIFRYVRAFGRALKFDRHFVWERDNWTCFVPETLILMSNGDLKPISAVLPGERVVDAYGNFVEVVNSRKKSYSGPLYRIRKRCCGDIMGVTPEHKILATSRDGKFDSSGVLVSSFLKDNKWFLFEPSFVKIIDESRLTIDLLQECHGKIKQLYVMDYGKTLRIGLARGKKTNRFVARDFDLGRLFGYFLSEGCVKSYRNVVDFCFNIKENRFIDDVVGIIKDKFGIQCKVRRNIYRHTAHVYCCSGILNVMFRGILDSSLEKRMRDKKYPKRFLEGVLVGMLLGDGCFNVELKRCVLDLGNEMLVRDMYVVASMLGIFPSLSTTLHRDDRKPSKSIVFQGFAWNSLIPLVRPFLDIEMAKHENPSSDRMKSGSLTMTGVTKYSIEEYCGDVWDLETSESHTYIANFTAVHNCQYCGVKIKTKAELTTDHVHPESKGGKAVYENMVTCCKACNAKKDNKTCAEAHMFPTRKPFMPQMSRSMAKVADEARRLLAIMDRDA